MQFACSPAWVLSGSSGLLPPSGQVNGVYVSLCRFIQVEVVWTVHLSSDGAGETSSKPEGGPDAFS